MEKSYIEQSGRTKEILQDQISHLPDDILVLILSRLSLEEASATSVLSNRWEHIWKFINRLNFDASKTLNEIESKSYYTHADVNRILLKSGRVNYVRWVSKVLRHHMGSELGEFRVCFDLTKDNKDTVDSWIQFALSRRSKNLDVNLVQTSGLLYKYENYSFPSHLCSESHMLPVFKSLKVLTLKNVNVSSEVLHCFLTNSPYLERLVVHNSSYLKNLEVSDPSIMLKYLEIGECYRMTTLKACSTNLVSIKVFSPELLLCFHNLQLLVEVSIGFVQEVDDAFLKPLSCLSQLEVLTLEAWCSMKLELHEYPLLPKLKQLVVTDDALASDDIKGFASLIKIAPYLEEFILQLKWDTSLWATPRRMDWWRRRKRVERCPHQCLKVVKFVGYYGRPGDLEFIRFMLKNAVVLEEIYIDPRDYFYVDREITPKDTFEGQKAAKSCAKQQLEGKVPSRVKLVIL